MRLHRWQKHQSLITSCFKAPCSPHSCMLMQFNLYTHPCWFHQAAKHPGCNLIKMQKEHRFVSQRWHFWKHEIARGFPSSCLKDIIHLLLTLSLFASSLSSWYPELIWWCILQSSQWLRHLHSSWFWWGFPRLVVRLWKESDSIASRRQFFIIYSLLTITYPSTWWARQSCGREADLISSWN